MRSLSLLAFLFVFAFTSCNTSTSTDKGTDATDATDAATTAKPAPTAKKYTLTPFTSSTEYPDAKINSVSYKNGKFSFDIADGEYKLGAQTPDAEQKMCANSGKGQHIHLIVNNGPYAAKYEPEFDYPMGHGDFYILGFLSRSYHESIKTADAHWLKKAHVHGNSINNPQDVTDPMVFYSRPKGTYTGKLATTKVMLDFYLANCTLGTDYMVHANINGENHILDKWQPYYIEGLPMGKNMIQLTLTDKDGNAVKTPLNPVRREFVLEEDPAEAAAGK